MLLFNLRRPCVRVLLLDARVNPRLPSAFFLAAKVRKNGRNTKFIRAFPSEDFGCGTPGRHTHGSAQASGDSVQGDGTEQRGRRRMGRCGVRMSRKFHRPERCHSSYRALQRVAKKNATRCKAECNTLREGLRRVAPRDATRRKNPVQGMVAHPAPDAPFRASGQERPAKCV